MIKKTDIKKDKILIFRNLKAENVSVSVHILTAKKFQENVLCPLLNLLNICLL